VRRAGEDYPSGATLLEAGRRLDPAAVGLLGSLGVARVRVAGRPKVALLATGDELLEPGEPMGYGRIYNSTRYALLPMLEAWGAEVQVLGRARDEAGATREALARGLEYDVLITTGGVSMGSRDLIRPTLLELGARELFWKVRQRPGKPIFAARRESAGGGGCLCLGLPGNPVSVFVTAVIYVRAALLRMQGAAGIELPWRGATASERFEKPAGLTVFARADWAGMDAANDAADGAAPRVKPGAAQGSHQFSALARCAGLVRLPEESGDIAPGESVKFLEMNRLLSI
jgi:molybdopterin molybdotransferase